MKKLCLLLAFLCAACVPPIPDNDEFTRFDEETVMGELQAAGELVAALPDDAGPAWADPEAGEGFAADVAREIAESLRVDLRFVAGPSADLVDMVDGGEADIAFPLVPITERLVRKHAFSDPVYIGHQRLLVPEGSGIEDVGDLSGEICSPVDETIGVDLLELNPSAAAVPLRPGDYEGCVDLIEEGLVEVATAPDVLLAAMLAELPGGYEVAGDELTTEAYGVSMESGASGWVDYVNKIITEFDQEGRWAESYERHFADLIGPGPGEPPNMTVEEAAALFPADLEET